MTDWQRPDDLPAVQQGLVSWYQADHRDFPWRETDDPYAILVSEVMSQQTQLSRVEPAWEAFLDRWPTVEALAAAALSDVVGFWSTHSLGYNNRARYLHESAQQIVTEHDGAVPETVSELQTLPGVGPYTASAVASFAFGAETAVVDTNVKRVLYRVFADIRDADDPDYEAVANAIMPPEKSGLWNNAIMELGGVACRKQPQCDEAGCPWREWCHAYRTGDFTAPDVPEQPSFEGSRRQFRGRIIEALSADGPLDVDDLGVRVRVDYTPTGTGDGSRGWLEELLEDLAADGLVEQDGEEVRLRESG